MQTYVVVNGFWHKSQWQAPGASIELAERDARYALLAGDIAVPAPAAPAAQ